MTQLILFQLFHRLVLFQFMLPVVQITLFCVCIGADPFHLHVAVINNDTGLLGYNMGQKFLDALDDYTVYQVRRLSKSRYIYLYLPKFCGHQLLSFNH